MFALVFMLATNTYPVTIHEVHDGDTVTATVHLDFDIAIINKPIRIYNFDAWEISRQRTSVVVTPEEIAKGLLAKKDLQDLLKTASKIHLEPKERGYDKYGRLLGTLIVYDKTGKVIDVADYMQKRGHQRK